VRTESFASAARRKLVVLTAIADVPAVAKPRGILLMSWPDEVTRPIALPWAGEASRLFCVAHRFKAESGTGELMRGSFCEGVN